MNSKKKTQPRGQCQDKISEQVTFSKQEKDAELPYHLLPKHTCQAMIINAFSLNEKSSAAFKLVVVSITIKYSKGSFKVSSGAFQPFNGAPAFTAELNVALTSEQSNHELTELNGLVVHHELIELIKGFVGHSKLTKLTSLVHVGHIKLFKLSRLIVD